MTDPYQVLGISRGASDEEIKKAYRNQSRKYHPDANVNKPERERAMAEERFKQVQQAYDQIMKEKQQGYSDYSGGASYQRYYGNNAGSGFGGYQGGYGQSDMDPKLQAAANYIRNQAYAEAMHVLNEIPFGERKGRWYYFSAIANAGTGNQVTATEHINQALRYEPSNLEYRRFKEHLEYGGTWYTSRGTSYGRRYAGAGAGAGWCLSMLFLNLLCNFFSFCGRPF